MPRDPSSRWDIFIVAVCVAGNQLSHLSYSRVLALASHRLALQPSGGDRQFVGDTRMQYGHEGLWEAARYEIASYAANMAPECILCDKADKYVR